MFRKCAWCDQFLGEAAPLDDYRTTYGLCPACGRDFASVPDEPLILTDNKKTSARTSEVVTLA